MDFFGVTEFVETNRGFGCQTPNCGNREGKCGSMFLPYCNEKLECAKKNIEWLMEQNLEQRGKISVYRDIMSSSVLPDQTHPKLPHNSIDRMDED